MAHILAAAVVAPDTAPFRSTSAMTVRPSGGKSQHYPLLVAVALKNNVVVPLVCWMAAPTVVPSGGMVHAGIRRRWRRETGEGSWVETVPRV